MREYIEPEMLIKYLRFDDIVTASGDPDPEEHGKDVIEQDDPGVEINIP